MPDFPAFNLLRPEITASLSKGMVELLKSVRVRFVPGLTYNGQELAGQYVADGENSAGRINLNPNARMPIEIILLHEALHAWDAAHPGSPMPPVDARNRQELFERYYHKKPRFTNENHIPIGEAYATAGQGGAYDIPPGLSPYYRDVFSALTPPQVRASRKYAESRNK